ncbi:hypothetical protein Tco_0520181 [Tanacetum coccineum]
MEEFKCRLFRGDKIKGMQAVVLGVMLQLHEVTKLGELTQQVMQRLFAATTVRRKATWQDNEIPTPLDFLTNDLDAFDYDCDEAPSASAVLMAELSSYDSEVLSEVPIQDNYLDNHVLDQNMQEMQYSEQPVFDNNTDIDITSNSNMISYEQYLKETKNTIVQDTSSSTQQEAMIMSVIEEMNNQVAKCNEHAALFVIDIEETLELAKESRLKMHAKQNDPIVKEKKEERKTFEIKEKELLLENDRLLELIISQDLVHTAVNTLAVIADNQHKEKSYLDEYNENLEL